jgi:hypothetical protein
MSYQDMELWIALSAGETARDSKLDDAAVTWLRGPTPSPLAQLRFPFIYHSLLVMHCHSLFALSESSLLSSPLILRHRIRWLGLMVDVHPSCH